MIIEKSVIIRTVVLIVALINQFILALGYNPLPFDNCEVSELVSTVITVAVVLWNWWKAMSK